MALPEYNDYDGKEMRHCAICTRLFLQLGKSPPNSQIDTVGSALR